MPRITNEERFARNSQCRWQRSDPKPPAHLTKAGRDEWQRITALLSERQQLDAIDQSSLHDYIWVFEGLLEAQDEIRKHGVLIAGRRKGERIKNPALQVIRTYREQFRRWCTEFGFTPMSRQRLGVHGGVATMGLGSTEALLSELTGDERRQ